MARLNKRKIMEMFFEFFPDHPEARRFLFIAAGTLVFSISLFSYFNDSSSARLLNGLQQADSSSAATFQDPETGREYTNEEVSRLCKDPRLVKWVTHYPRVRDFCLRYGSGAEPIDK